jgi:hypothetical protein
VIGDLSPQARIDRVASCSQKRGATQKCMMDPTALSDDELFRTCQEFRVQATLGDQNAMHEARVLETEARRRFHAATTIARHWRHCL